MRVLIVEDDPDLSLLLRLYLGQKGCVCAVADTLAQAKQSLSNESFDYMLLELVLPDGFGLDLLPLLAVRQDQPVGVIVASGNILPSLFTDHRIRGVFQKPFDLARLWQFMLKEVA